MDPESGPGRNLPFTATPRGVRIAVRVIPRAARTAFAGIAADANGRAALQLRVAAAPVEGAANAALVDFFARTLKLRKAEVQIVSGETARFKLVELSGDAAVLVTRLAEWLVREGGPPGR